MSIWATSVSIPAGKTVGGKTDVEIGKDIQAALAAGNKGKLISVMDSLHAAGYTGSYNASQPFLDLLGRSKYTGIVPAAAATSPEATIKYAADNKMLAAAETKAVKTGGAKSQAEATKIGKTYSPAELGLTSTATSDPESLWKTFAATNAVTKWVDDPGNKEKVRLAEQRGIDQYGSAPDYLKYIQMNPGLREGVEALGFTKQETIDWAKWHWSSHGESEFAGGAGGRLNTPWVTMIPTEQFAQPNPTDIAGFEAFIRRAGQHPGLSVSEMWTARGDIDPAWNLGQFTGQGWNFDPDAPYMRGLLGDNINVEAGVGQLWSEGDPRFIQDRYIDAAIANDFPVGWVGEGGSWEGPTELAGYWGQLTNAIRNEVGELRAVEDRPDTGWEGMDVLPVGDRWSGNVRPADTTLADQGGLGSAYRPWTQSYWDKYLGPDVKQSLFSMKAPPVEQSLAYLPGEFRDPAGWRAVLDASGDYMENIPAGAWRRGTMGPSGLNAPGWPTAAQGNPWQFTSPASATNIAYVPGFTGADISPEAATEWSGLLGTLTNPALMNTTNLLGGTT